MNAQQIKRRIRAHLAYWIPALGLTTWTIAVRWSTPVPAAGTSSYDIGRAEARVAFAVRHMRARHFTDAELERTVVHELLHLVVRGGTERLINTLAQTLVRLRRGAIAWEEAA